jgi:hypothetical protein
MGLIREEAGTQGGIPKASGVVNFNLDGSVKVAAAPGGNHLDSFAVH